MTFDERVRALAPLGLMDRQTRFLATVLLHSGYCLRRQYAAFAGVRYGKTVRDFLDALVARDLATRDRYEVNRGHLYHVHARPLYRLVGQEDNRNRRHIGAALIARKLMVLDFVIGEAAAEWFATEDDKVAFFRDRLGVPVADLPHRVYTASDPAAGHTTRYFVHKLPIFLAGEPARVHLTYLVIEPSGRLFREFLREHASLLRHLPRWTVVVVTPIRVGGLDECRSAFDEFASGTLGPGLTLSTEELRWYFETRRAVERDDLSRVSVADIHRFRDARHAWSARGVERLYTDWLVNGDGVIDGTRGDVARDAEPRGRLVTRVLPFTYSQSGSLAGVA
jgi:hypothetical protein